MGELQGHSDLVELVLLALQGEITPAQMEQLDHLLKTEPGAIDAYVNLMELYTNLSSVGSVEISRPNDTDDFMQYNAFLEILAEEERTAQAVEVEIEQPMPEKMPVEMLKTEKLPRVINKFSMGSAIVSIAALFFLVFYVLFVPPAASTVATIEDSIDAQWAQSDYSAGIGSQIWDNEGSRWLLKGTVEVLFDYGAEVIIEAPAEYEVTNDDEMILYSGRLYATVPSRAAGFTVQTPNSTVIDMGTEFGVEVGFDGRTGVHMFKGEASLIPGEAGKKGKKVDLFAGQAKNVDSFGQLHDTEIKRNSFIRRIDSERGFVWRGEQINLVDLASGGNGLGFSTPQLVIDPMTGGKTSIVKVDAMYANKRNLSNEYSPVSWSPVIDGVFVPNGDTPQIVSSQGDVFQDCPPTLGYFYLNILFNPSTVSSQMQGVRYGEGARPGLLMHANLGVTFDLQAIRDQYSDDINITRFTSKLGITDVIIGKGHADVWVLVDGELRFKHLGLMRGQIENISVELSETNRFLTLVSTDGGDEDTMQNRHSGPFSDWCLFAEPVLQVE